MTSVAVVAPQGAFREIAPGFRIGEYAIVARLARGGMAEVYLARDVSVGGAQSPVALKFILPQMADEAAFVSMFLNEARVAATLSHPNIAQVLRAGEVRGEPYLVMEFVHGQTVQAILAEGSAEQRTLPLGCAVEIVARACAGLHFAHERCDAAGTPLQIVHRDVSPGNLMVGYDGSVKVLDFGIAKAATQTTATATGVLKGKSGYMSPEQCSDELLDARSDVFNLGILLYELTTGKRAFFGANPISVLNKVVNGRFELPRDVVPDYPPQLEAIVLCAMAVDRGDRFSSAAAMQGELARFAHEHGLDGSARAIAESMAAVFGPPPPVPTTAQVPDRRRTATDLTELAPRETTVTSYEHTEPSALVPGSFRARWRTTIVLPLAVATVLGGTGAWLASNPEHSVAVETNVHAADPVPHAEEPIEEPAEADPQPVAAIVEQLAPGSDPGAGGLRSESVSTTAPPPKKKRRKRRGATSGKKAARKGPVGMYP